jgi:hypothetical protein
VLKYRRVLPTLPWEFPQVEDKRPLPEPTTAPAGSDDKLTEFARRASLNLQLFHPDDPRDGAPQVMVSQDRDRR